MSKTAFILVWALAVTASAPAARHKKSSASQPPLRVTVGELSQMLRQAQGESDAKLARRLSTLELTERPGDAMQARWQVDYRDKETLLALTELADAAAFLDPPASENLRLPQPDDHQLEQIVQRAADYVKQTSPRLPDFYSLRTTIHFEDAPVRALDWPEFCKTVRKNLVLGSGCQAIGGGKPKPGEAGMGLLRVTGETSEIVTYRDGHEVLTEESAHAPAPLKFLGLVTSGEFGPILAVALGDAAQGKISWGYWEQGPGGPLAVFRYRVPGSESHYEVDYPSVTGPERVRPGYHGEIAVDAASGTIWRITIVSDLDMPQQDVITAIMVEYGPVILGGAPYICPLRSVAYSKVPVFTRREGKDIELPGRQIRLNDIRFSAYHLFRGDLKIMPDNVTYSPPAPPPADADGH